MPRGKQMARKNEWSTSVPRGPGWRNVTYPRDHMLMPDEIARLMKYKWHKRRFHVKP